MRKAGKLHYLFYRLLAVPALGAACLAATPAQSQEALKSLGPVPEAAKALAPRALADLNRMIAQGHAFFDLSQGVACKVDIGRLQQASDQAAATAGGGLATVIQDSARSMLSGACPGADGLFQGPVEYIDASRVRSEVGSIVVDAQNQARVQGVYAQGRLVGESSTFRRSGTTTLHRLTSGELVAPQGAQAQDITYHAIYAAHEPSGRTIRPDVQFSWNAKQKIVTLMLTERPAVNRQIGTLYNNGQPYMRMRSKDGVYHGWMEYFDPALVQLKQDKVCYQNGTQIKALQCPDT